ncbi:MAG: branched-chain amino acid ABC transporter permease [Acetobacteraceae bacterium]|nr:branched-chain amino acid ABC transporter permease [Acetobacteraceae bacterium]
MLDTDVAQTRPPPTRVNATVSDTEGRLEPWRLLAVAVVVGVGVALTWLVNGYHLFQLSMTIAYACAILGLTVLTGINGQISLGHGAFYAVGAYTTAVLMANYNWPYWTTIPPAAAASALIGFLVGFPALRLSGLYLALTTLALAVATPQILKTNALSDITGGVQGLTVDKPEAPFGLGLNPDQWIYLFTLAVGCVIFLLGWNLMRGRIGRAMMAIRDQSLAAESMGINLAAVKTRTFAVSAMFTGVAGSLTTIIVQFVAPDSFNSFLSIYFFVGLVVGGVNSILGALFGGAFIEFVPNVANQISKAAPGAIYGLILIAFMYLLPAGIAGGLYRVVLRLVGTRRRAAARSG